MKIPPEYEEPVQEIRDLYDEAEAALKTVGRVRNELCVAAVNQLRYAGQHLVRALAETDEAIIKDELGAAKRHALRAIYDVYDASIQFHLDEINQIRKTYPVNFKDVVPDYTSIIKAVQRASKHIEQKGYQNRRDRKMLYRELREDVEALTVAYSELMTSLPDIVSAASRHNREISRAWISIAVTVPGVAATAIFITLRVMSG